MKDYEVSYGVMGCDPETGEYRLFATDEEYYDYYKEDVE